MDVVGTRPLIFCSYAATDHSLFAELAEHLAILEREGLLQVWSREQVRWSEDSSAVVTEQLRRADVVLLLVSADYLASDITQPEVDIALERMIEGRTIVLPVIVRPCAWELAPWAKLQALPRGARPVTTWSNHDEAWLDVIRGVRSALVHGVGAGTPAPSEAYASGASAWPELSPPSPHPATLDVPASPSPPPAQDLVVRPIGDIFRTTGQPDITFVEPSQLPAMRASLRVMGQGLVIEGPSGIGKTTAMKRAILDVAQGVPLLWLKAQKDSDREALDAALAAGFKGHLIIDDFHQLDGERKRRVAIAMKHIADDDTRDAKMTVIGINPVGVSLVQGFPDLTGRFQVVAMGKQPDDRVAELIRRGEQAANIIFNFRHEFIIAAAGSFFTAQLLCYQAAVRTGISETAMGRRRIHVRPQDVMEDVLSSLRLKYNAELLAFAGHDEVTPPRGACLVLLWLLQENREGYVAIEEARYRYPQLASAFDWLKSSQLARCFDRVPRLHNLLHYNRSAGILSADDPQLEFYLRNMQWADFATRTGHRHVRFETARGLVIGTEDEPTGRLPTSEAVLLHLSDLHFTGAEQVELWYGQLAEDLRELGCRRLDALVLSGDLTQASLPAEYAAARAFLSKLAAEFELSPDQLVLVPGNHDLSWARARAAYRLHHRDQYQGSLEEGRFIAHGTDVVEVRDDDAHRHRFTEFAAFYGSVKGHPYPTEYAEQATIHDFPRHNLLLLGLNSAWQIDHHFRSRAGIAEQALAQALTRIRQMSTYAGRIKIAVWHHPLTGPGEDRITDVGFMQQLAKAGFRIILHGHIHKSENGVYRYDMAPDGRRIDIISAGTFGAPTRDWVPGYPLQYNLLRLAGESITVETRCREEPNGAWRPDARWLQGGGRDPLPRYKIRL